MINPNNELFKWGPIDGRPIYPFYWYEGMILYNKRFPPGWPDSIGYIEDEKLTFIADYEELYSNGEETFKKYVLDEDSFKKFYNEWVEVIKEFEMRILEVNDLAIKEDKELLKLYKDWNEFYNLTFWDVSLLPEIANFGGERILMREIKGQGVGDNFLLVFEKLSAPTDYSFYQNEEIDLLKAKGDENKLREHQKKYFWILNSYHRSKVLPVDNFRKEQAKYSNDEAEQKIKEIEKSIINAKKDKNFILKKYGFSDYVKSVSDKLSFCIWWQDFRKTYIFMADHIISLFLEEISKRFSMDIDDLHYYTHKELELLILGNNLDQEELSDRKKAFLVYFDCKKGIRLYSGPEAKHMFEPYKNVKVEDGVSELKGVSTFISGMIKGRVRILRSSKDINKLVDGEVLVTPMTSPDFIVAMRKASAIITDEGGMTCHAAIVSRELKVPCIVSTRIATKVLKDGDMVEVDANSGIVRRIT